ncbi:MAG: pyridoxamine 5'-phosphate oxidase family protein [Acidimicrobiia bacterium]
MADAIQVYRDRPTEEEIDSVLAKRTSAAVGTLNPDGSVHLSYVIFLHDQGRIWFETSSVTRKARNLSRDGRVSILVQGTAATGRHLMTSIEGMARLLTGDEAAAAKRRLRAKYIKPEALDDLGRAWDRFDDVVVEVSPTRRRSWTGSVLHAETQRELAADYDDVWLDD